MDEDEQRVAQEDEERLYVSWDRQVEEHNRRGLSLQLPTLVVDPPCVDAEPPEGRCQSAASATDFQSEGPRGPDHVAIAPEGPGLGGLPSWVACGSRWFAGQGSLSRLSALQIGVAVGRSEVSRIGVGRRGRAAIGSVRAMKRTTGGRQAARYARRHRRPQLRRIIHRWRRALRRGRRFAN